jgi:hypothetical protein
MGMRKKEGPGRDEVKKRGGRLKKYYFIIDNASHGKIEEYIINESLPFPIPYCTEDRRRWARQERLAL